jgi:hypothetical protein
MRTSACGKHIAAAAKKRNRGTIEGPKAKSLFKKLVRKASRMLARMPENSEKPEEGRKKEGNSGRGRQC